MIAAKLFLGALLAVLLAADVVTLARRARRALALEIAVFLGGGAMVAFPESTTWLAARLGISRGVDVVLYVLVIFLVREAILSRSARLEQEERTTEIVRALALRDAKRQRP